MDKRVIAILVFSTCIIKALFTLLPDDPTPHSYFILVDQQITLQSHIYFMSWYCIWAVMMMVIYEVWIEGRKLMWWFLLFALLEFFEYFLTYNIPLIFVPILIYKVEIRIPVSVENVRLVAMFFVTINQIKRWNLG